MKNLDEMKMLVQMAKAFGQPIDSKLVEAIEREETLNKKLFTPKSVPQPPVPTPPPPPPPVVAVPPKKDLIQQSVDAISNPKFAKPLVPDLHQKELDGIRKQIAEIIQKMGTLSWGGGGTGSVRIGEMDDLDKSTLEVGKFLTWNNGTFYMDDVNTNEVTHNTTLVTTNSYTVQSGDYYIGVNYAGPVTITLPVTATSGRLLVVKDESGNCRNNAITISGNIDNDAGGAILTINNGAVDLLFRNGWRII